MATERNRPAVKVQELYEALLVLLDHSDVRIGAHFFATKELSQRYNVSYLTAHRALALVEKDGYISRINGYGTFIKKPYSGKLKSIGMSLRLLGNPATAAVFQAIRDLAAVHGVKIIGDSTTDEAQFFAQLAAVGTKAVIRFPQAPHLEHRIWKMLMDNGLNAVFINNWHFDEGPFPTVRTDESLALRTLLDHLWENNHRKIVLRQEGFYDTRHRLTGEFLQWHWQHELKLSQESVQYIGFEDMNEAFFQRLSDIGFTAIVCSFAVDAVHLISLPSYRRFADHFSVVAIEDIPAAAAAGLTVYAQDTNAIAAKTLEILSRAPGEATGLFDIAGRLICRNSVKKRLICRNSVKKRKG